MRTTLKKTSKLCSSRPTFILRSFASPSLAFVSSAPSNQSTPALTVHEKPYRHIIRKAYLDRYSSGHSPFLPRYDQCPVSFAQPDVGVLIRLIREASSSGSSRCCSQLHCCVLKHGSASNVYISSSLVHCYGTVESINDASKLFDEIPELNVVSWNSLLCGYVHSGQYHRALEFFTRLVKSGTRADAFSFTSSLTACARSNWVHFGMCIHAKIVKCGWDASFVVCNCLIDMYGKCGLAEEAIDMFSRMSLRDVISWNSVISACARNDQIEQAFAFLQQMPNPDTISYNEVISGIAQFGEMDDAIHLLESMPDPSPSSWNSIITGLVNRGQARKALDVFSRMHLEGAEKDQFTFSSILSGIGFLASLSWGTAIHCCTVKHGLDLYVVGGSALVDMYAKCGEIKNAELMFQSLACKNLVTWNAMLSGLAHNGKFEEVIQLYRELPKDIKPDEITFLNVLSACSHCKVPLHTAMQYFESMVDDYGIEPTAEHCCSMIRVMGQRGVLRRAERMIYGLGFGSCGSVWRALLSACGCSAQDLKVAEVAAAKVIQLMGDEDYVYVALSNIYGFHGKWSDMDGVRKLMRLREVQKGAGFSWIEVENSFVE